MADEQEMGKEEVINGLKHMAAYLFLSLLNIEQHGLKNSTPEKTEQFVAAEQHQLGVLKGAIFHLSGQRFDTEELRALNAARGAKT